MFFPAYITWTSASMASQSSSDRNKKPEILRGQDMSLIPWARWEVETGEDGVCGGRGGEWGGSEELHKKDRGPIDTRLQHNPDGKLPREDPFPISPSPTEGKECHVVTQATHFT